MRCSSVASPLDGVRNNTKFYYYPPPVLPSVKELLGVKDVHDELCHPALRGLFQLCLLYFVRIGELLNLRMSHVVHPDRVVCVGTKHSRSYSLYIPSLSSQIDVFSFLSDDLPIFPFTYHHCWLWCKKIGLFKTFGSSKNSSVLHLGRYLFARSASNLFKMSIITDCLRHRRIGSTLFYLK